MATAETRTGIIALSVAMLGEAPGTDRLNDWIEKADGGMTLSDLANHIAESDAFKAAYPAFLTSGEFAEAFLGNVLGDNVSGDLMTAAVGIVTGLLNEGLSRGGLALAVVGALHDIAETGMDHPAYGDLGMAAMAFANQLEVASHYTLDARMADPSSDALAGVTADADSVSMAIDAIDNPPAPPETMQGQDFELAKTRDNIRGTDYDDNILADADGDGFATLNGFDTIDGGGGHDILSVYDISTDLDRGEAEYDAQVSNIERLDIFTRGGIHADLSGWEGLEHVELAQFARSGNVNVTVDGATVSTDRTFGGNVTIVGAMGEASVNAGKTSAVKVGSGAHTTSVMTKGGMTVDVNANGAGGQSMTVTSVALDSVTGEGLGGDGKRGNPMEAVGVTIPAAQSSSTTASAELTVYVTVNGSDGTNVDATAEDFEQNYYKAATQPDYLTAGEVAVTTDKEMAEMREQVFVDGKRVAPGTEGAVSGKDSGGVPIHIHSDVIESVSLSNTYATIAVINKSEEAEDLAITVDKYGSAAVAGKFCITGDGAAENVGITVAGDSNFALANNATKAVSISGDADLTLDVTNFVGPPTNVDAGGDNTPTASGTLESITNSGSGKLTMNVAGMGKLESIDASASSGANSIRGIGDSVESVDGGSGGDSIAVAAFAEGGLTVNLGAGSDTFSSAGGNVKSRVDGGEGVDVLHLTGASATYKADGKDVSIFSNFEALEVGGSAEAVHDVKLLGIESVTVSASTADSDAATEGLQASAVTLNNMANDMGFSVIGKAGMGTTAAIVHSMAPRSAGDPRYSGELDVSLTANGSKGDTAMAGTGVASLTLTADGEIEILNVASNANLAGKGIGSAYRNSLVLMGADETVDTPDAIVSSVEAIVSSVEAIVVSGSAAATVSFMQSDGTGAGVAQFANLELIDAEDNAGGVTFDANTRDDEGAVTASLAQALEMVGGSGRDMFTGGSGDDELMGNGGIDELVGGAGNDELDGGAGGDMLTGGGGDDTFKYGSVSESQVVFGAKGMSGFDTITDFGDGTNVIALGKTLYESLGGTIRRHAAIDGTDLEATGTPDSLKAFLDGFKDGDGVFESRGPAVLGAINSKGPLIEHSVATVAETYWMTPPVVDDPNTTEDETAAGVSANRTWLLIDVDGDGDFDAATDMAIALTGAGLAATFADTNLEA